MSFLSPWLLLGLGAAAVPILIHLFGRRPHTRIAFPAMQLLERAERRISSRRRLRDLLLLASRVALVVILTTVFARPTIMRPGAARSPVADADAVALVIDDSASMTRVVERRTAFEHARRRAEELLRELPRDASVTLVSTARGVDPPLPALTADRSRVMRALAAMRPTFRVADYTTALARATQLLRDGQRSRRRVVVLTDGQAAGWPPRGPVLAGAEAPEVVWLDVTGAWENRAVVDVTVEPALELGPGGVAITAEIADFTADGSRGLGVTLRVDDAVVGRGEIDLAAGGRARKRFLHVVSSSDRPIHDVQVDIDPDDLSIDDRRYARFAGGQLLRALLVNGDPRTEKTEDEFFFLATALRTTDPGAALETALPDDVSADELARFNLVVLANVAAPSPGLADALAAFVRAGGGLLLTVGARVDPSVWNQRLAAVLPQPLGLPRTATSRDAETGEVVYDRAAERLAPLDRRHPLLERFPTENAGLGQARFFKYYLLESLPDTAGRSLILRFDTGAPVLVERQVGRGRVLLFASTIDREWTDLPIRPGFLPLMAACARRLVGATDDGAGEPRLVGEAVTLPLPPAARALDVIAPDGLTHALRAETAVADSLTFAETTTPGIYRVRRAETGDRTSAVAGFAVNIDPAESNPAPLSPERRPAASSRADARAAPPQRVELWHALAAALILLLLGESLLTLRSRSITRPRPATPWATPREPAETIPPAPGAPAAPATTATPPRAPAARP